MSESKKIELGEPLRSSENSVPNIWKAQENAIHLYKIAIMTLVAALTVSFMFLVMNYFRNPLVIVKSEQEIEYYPTQRRPIEIGKPEIELFTKEFLKSLYVWTDYNTERIKKDIAPYVESELSTKLMDGQSQKYEKDLKGKKLSQAITFVDVDVLNDKVIAHFDRVIKIEGIPLIMPTELTLTMVKGTPTALNPMGVYITGVEEHEGSK